MTFAQGRGRLRDEEQGRDTPAEQALSMGEPLEDVVNARRRLFREAANVAGEIADALTAARREQAGPESEEVA